MEHRFRLVRADMAVGRSNWADQKISICCLLFLALAGACSGPNIQESVSPNPPEVAGSRAEDALLFVPPFDLGAGFPKGTAKAKNSDVLKEGQPAPVFEIEFSDGTRFSTQELAGRALLINFWATWCGPCRHEIPLILEQQARHPEDFLVLAVNVKEDPEKVAAFATEFAMDIPVILDPPGDIVRQFEVRGYPTSIFVNANGLLVAKWQGVLDAAKLEELTNASLLAHDRDS